MEEKRAVRKTKRNRKMNDKTRNAVISISILVLLLLSLYQFVFKNISFLESEVYITEVMASNRFVKSDEDGEYRDWIEIHNSGKTAINLQGYGLSDDEAHPFKWVFPHIIIEPGEYLLIFASGKDRTTPDSQYLHTNFRINRVQDTLYFSSKNGRVIDRIEIENHLPNISYGRDTGNKDKWLYYINPTPKEANRTEGTKNLLLEEVYNDSPVYVNEIMASNKNVINDEDGDYPDWIEICNSGNTPVNLSNYTLSDEKDNPLKWLFPETVLQPGEYLVVFASGKDRSDPKEENLHTNFRINRTNDTLYFRYKDGRIIDKIQVSEHEPDISYGRSADDPATWLFYMEPTPGMKNHRDGIAYIPEEVPSEFSYLQINEIMAMNVSTLEDDKGNFPNWIEIYNLGNTSVNLDGFGLSNRDDKPMGWVFPETTIEPGEYMIVFASGEDRYDLEKGVFHTNFGISTLGAPVVFTDPLGRTIDRAYSGRLPEGISYGRNPNPGNNGPEWVYFNSPSPGSANRGSGYNGFTRPPEFVQKGGFYSSSVTLEIKSPHNEIRYTLDGSIPTPQSKLYTGPVAIDKTSVVRAKAFEDRKLAGDDTIHTYFIGVEHTLSVISVAIDPVDFNAIHSIRPSASLRFPYQNTNLWMDIEQPAHFQLYETSGKLGYEINCGFKIFGAYSRAMDQKSFAIYARNRYEYDEMTYPFLENKPLINFKHLVLRTSGQDTRYTKIRDIMMTSLLEDTSVDYQGYRQSVLYINGQYWGIYNIREKINRYFIANNHGLDDVDNMDILEGNARSSRHFKAGDNKHYMEMLDFIRNNDMNKPENYEYIKTILDVESLADFKITSMYFAQTDNGNIRFWRERSPEGKWRWIIYDLDWAMWRRIDLNSLRAITNPAGTGIGNMFSTELIRGMLRSDEFTQLFIERFAYHMNVTFHPDRVIEAIDRLAGNIESEMPMQIERWNPHVSPLVPVTLNADDPQDGERLSTPYNMAHWEREVERLRDFARRRPGYVVQHIKDYFRLSNTEMEIFDAWRER